MCRIDFDGFLAGGIHEWMEGNQRSHAALFTAIRELNRECHRFLSGLGVDRSSSMQRTMAVLFARMMELFQSVFISVEHGILPAGRILSRSLLEAFFYFMAIKNDPQFLDEYLDQIYIFQKRLGKGIRESFEPSLAGLRGNFDENRAMEIERHIREDEIKELRVFEAARRAKLLSLYFTVYRFLSGAVHTAAWDLEESHVEYDDKNKEIRKFKYGPSDSETRRLLGCAGMSMAESLETISAIFGQNRSEFCTRMKHVLKGIMSN